MPVIQLLKTSGAGTEALTDSQMLIARGVLITVNIEAANNGQQP
jgi:hypothetical protein